MEQDVTVGAIYGVWRVVEIYDRDGEAWVKVQHTRNKQVSSRLAATDIATLEGSA